MDSRELRIGNLVMGGDKIIVVENINESGINGQFDICESKYYFDCGLEHMKYKLDIAPIPLTEEWLVRFGFKFEDEDSEEKYFRNQIGYGIRLKNKYLAFQYPSRHVVEIEIASVHQLQNLYFALTGEELKDGE